MGEAVTLESKEQEQGLFIQGIGGNLLSTSFFEKKNQKGAQQIWS